LSTTGYDKNISAIQWTYTNGKVNIGYTLDFSGDPKDISTSEHIHIEETFML
jgi:hypothetical protein